MTEYLLQGGPLDGQKLSLPHEGYDLSIRYVPESDDDQDTIDLSRLFSDRYVFDDSDQLQPVLTSTPCRVWQPDRA